MACVHEERLYRIIRARISISDVLYGNRLDDETSQESRARLFRRTRHLGHPQVAAGHLRLRGGDLHRRHRPGRGAGRACARRRKQFGVKEIFIDDLREEFVRDFVFPMFRANAIYEGEYLLGTSIARPLIAKRQVEIARKTGCDAIAHGATGKGNDQVRFELGAYALWPEVKIIAPWREWDLTSREKLLAYAAKHGIPVAQEARAAARRTRWTPTRCTSPTKAAGWKTRGGRPRTTSGAGRRIPEDAPDRPEYVDHRAIDKGDPVAVNGRKLSPFGVLDEAQRARRPARHRPARSGREPLRRHEVARLLRDAGRHASCSRRIAPSSRCAWTARSRT